jgi:hypothetical protein
MRRAGGVHPRRAQDPQRLPRGVHALRDRAGVGGRRQADAAAGGQVAAERARTRRGGAQAAQQVRFTRLGSCSCFTLKPGTETGVPPPKQLHGAAAGDWLSACRPTPGQLPLPAGRPPLHPRLRCVCSLPPHHSVLSPPSAPLPISSERVASAYILPLLLYACVCVCRRLLPASPPLCSLTTPHHSAPLSISSVSLLPHAGWAGASLRARVCVCVASSPHLPSTCPILSPHTPHSLLSPHARLLCPLPPCLLTPPLLAPLLQA